MKTLELIHKIAKKERVRTYLQDVLEAFQTMDYHKLNDLLYEDCLYEDMKKTSFIYRQMRIFQFFREQGDTFLNLSTNICTGCLCSEPVFVLTGNNSETKYGIYVKFVEDEIVDIFICSEQSSYLGLMPF